MVVADTGFTYCKCTHFFDGQLCEKPRVCFNGGQVQADGTCICTPGYHGLQCDQLTCVHGHMLYTAVSSHENPALYCDPSKCDNSDLPSSFTPDCAKSCRTYCYCQRGYKGDTCDTIDHCFNGGTLRDGNCTCPDGFSGDLCQVNNNCANGYSHLNANYTSSCQCNPGFQLSPAGKCEDIDECHGSQLPVGCPTGGPVHCVNTIGESYKSI